MLGNERADDGLADHLAGVEGNVLTHVGQVRRHQQQARHAQPARLDRNQQQLDQFVVGTVQAAVQHHLRWQRLALGQRQAQAQFIIGETVALDAGRAHAQRFGQAQGRLAFIGEIPDLGVHQHSTNSGASSSARPRVKPSLRRQA